MMQSKLDHVTNKCGIKFQESRFYLIMFQDFFDYFISVLFHIFLRQLRNFIDSSVIKKNLEMFKIKISGFIKNFYIFFNIFHNIQNHVKKNFV